MGPACRWEREKGKGRQAGVGWESGFGPGWRAWAAGKEWAGGGRKEKKGEREIEWAGLKRDRVKGIGFAFFLKRTTHSN